MKIYVIISQRWEKNSEERVWFRDYHINKDFINRWERSKQGMTDFNFPEEGLN